MTLESESPPALPAKTRYTCPMHPEIEQDEPGDSPICGMALEPMTVTLEEENPELVNGHVMAWPNGVGLATALASYQDEEFIAFSRGKIIEGREMVNATFRRNGIEPLPSQANFVYADIGRDATEFAGKMAERNILIRGSFSGAANFSRVSMGKLEDLEEFDRVFTEVYNT